ncbi:MAG: MarC family protein [Rhodobacteraceae bacterium]|nr:MarC family protein [Paracoccaceae bacterium]
MLSAFVTLLLVIDPIGLAPIFVAMTQGRGNAQRRAIAFRACAIAAGILTLFGVFGTAVLDLMGISLPAFRIAGGLLLFLIAVEMLFERRSQRREGRTADEDHDPSVFPLATPLIAGPGAMATMILLASAKGAGWADKLQAHIALFAVIGLVLGLFLIAGPIERALGRTGIVVVTRLLGMLLGALAVQFVLDGLADLGLLGAPKG